MANRLHQTQDQLKSDIRTYCDNDEEGPGKRWVITPDDPDDPPAIKNSQLPRFYPPGIDEKNPPPVQQWQDEINWVRMSLGSSGCKQGVQRDSRGPYDDINPKAWSLKYPMGEVQHRKFESERTPAGINPERVTLTVGSVHEWRS
jgi:hypothetical protein